MSTQDLNPSKRRFLDAMRSLGFGRFECLGIRNGELVLDPWPTMIRYVKFGVECEVGLGTTAEDFGIERQVSELFKYIRGAKAGQIRTLEIRNGLPFAMTVEDGTPNCSSNRERRG